jgi:hypothetical protein
MIGNFAGNRMVFARDWTHEVTRITCHTLQLTVAGGTSHRQLGKLEVSFQ